MAAAAGGGGGGSAAKAASPDRTFFRRAREQGIKELTGHTKKVHTLAWSCDGKRLASGSVDKNVNVWRFGASSSGTLDQELKGHTDVVDQLTWDPTHPDLLASASSDKSVRMWDGRSGKCAANIPTKGENINIAWSPDGNVIAVGDKEDQVSFIDKRTHTLLGAPWSHKVEVNEISWNAAGNLFFLTTGNGTVEVFEYGAKPPYENLWSLTAHTQNCYCLEFDPRDRYFAVGSADALVSLWDLATFTCVRTIDRLDWPVRTLGFSADGQHLAAGSEDLFIVVADVSTGETVHEIATDAATNALAWHPTLPILAFGCDRAAPDEDRRRPPSAEGAVRIFGAGVPAVDDSR